MLRSGTIVLIAVAASLACRGDPGPTESRAAFESAHARWESSKPTTYTFVAHRSCECTADFAGPVRITVAGGVIANVRRVSDGGPVGDSLWFTVDGLFDLIESELATRPDRVGAEYHAIRGYPTSVTYGMPEVDAGATITISSFEAPPSSSPRT